jgi:hypothetical protein
VDSTPTPTAALMAQNSETALMAQNNATVVTAKAADDNGCVESNYTGLPSVLRLVPTRSMEEKENAHPVADVLLVEPGEPGEYSLTVLPGDVGITPAVDMNALNIMGFLRSGDSKKSKQYWH